MKLFYIASNNKQEGPYTFEELQAKKIEKGTLTWMQGLNDWTRAEDINELSELFISAPPPLPKSQEKIYKVDAIISKKKKPINPEIKIITANEIKTNFQLIIFALIIGILSFPIFYFGIYNAPKYDNADFSKIRIEQRGGSISIYGAPGDLFVGYTPSMFNIQSQAKSIAKNRKTRLTEKSFTSSFITLLVSAGLIILVRYLSKGVGWVIETSDKKESNGHNNGL